MPTLAWAVALRGGELRGGRCSGRRQWWVVLLGGRKGGRGAEGRRWGSFIGALCRWSGAGWVVAGGAAGERCGAK